MFEKVLKMVKKSTEVAVTVKYHLIMKVEGALIYHKKWRKREKGEK